MASSGLEMVLVVEDDPAIGGGVVRALRAAGFGTELCATARGALDVVARSPPACVVLDLNLPDRSGFELLEVWQTRHGFPIIVLTARTELEDRLRSFGLGAADYLAKPFWMDELVARVRSRLKRPAVPQTSRVITFDDVTVDLDARLARRGEETLALTPIELNVLLYLVTRAGRAVAREQITEAALSPDELAQARTVDSHVARLRKKLGPAGGRIQTVWGIGYRFRGEGP